MQVRIRSKKKDRQGRLIDTIADIGFIGYDLYRVGQAYYNGGDVRAELGYLGLDVAGAATPFGTGFGLAARAAKGASVAADGAKVSPQVAGRAGELAAFAKQVRGTYNVDGRQRILDNVIAERNEFYEAKNVANQANTRQLRDFMSYAKQHGVGLSCRSGRKSFAVVQSKRVVLQRRR
jgi:hypothetical protein